MRSIDSMTDDNQKLEFEIKNKEWATQLQQGLEEYMGRLYDSVDAEEGSPEADVDTESGEPFCACNVCESREILSYTVPRAIHGYLTGAVTMYVNGEPLNVEVVRQES